MAAIPVTLVGSAYLTGVGVNPLAPVPVTIVADLTYTGLAVGGGPIVPPEQPPHPEHPPHPAFPIWGPPGINFPDKPGYPPTVGGGPIIPPDQPPTELPPQPPVQPVYGWSPITGWFVVYLPTPGTPVVTPSENAPPPAT